MDNKWITLKQGYTYYMTYTQTASVIGAVLAVIIGGIGIFLQWFGVPDGMGLILAGLSILGVHASGSVAGSLRR